MSGKYRLLVVSFLIVCLSAPAFAASTGNGNGGGTLNQSSGAIMNANRTQTYSLTGATYWDNTLKKFVVSPDYYHYWADETWQEQSRSRGTSLKVDGFALSWRSYGGLYMNVTLTKDKSVNFLWGDPHWNVNGVHTYEVPQKTSYWYDFPNGYSVRFICNYMLWDLSVITNIEVYTPGNTRYAISLDNTIVKYQTK